MKHVHRPQYSHSSESGGALAITLLAVTAVTVLSMGFVQVSSSISNRQAAAVENKRAFYLAEAGLAESYTALMAGKSGQVGFDEWPAAFGSGAFWVDVQSLGENRLRLDSHGFSGSGRASLSLVVEAQSRNMATLGFFSSQSIRIPRGVVIDSFDSSIGTYQDHVDNGLPRTEALLGSNAGISVGEKGKAGRAEVLGDAVPGVGNTVDVNPSSVVTGSTAPRARAEMMTAVPVPPVALEPGVTHDSTVPFVIPPGEVGYEEILLRGDGILTITGPATVVAGEFTAQDRSEIVFDTTHGAVDLYVTGALALTEDVALTTTAPRPADVRILVAGTDEVRLMSKSQLVGTLYAPQALVTIGSEFELFGALAALRIVLSDHAKVHVDRALGTAVVDEESPLDVLAWRVVEVPAPALRLDPFRKLGVARDELPAAADAHDLSDVMLSVTYATRGGVQKTYDGPEEGFNWKQVGSVSALHRSLVSKHWEHDCSQHRDPQLGQNGYDGSTTSLDSRETYDSTTSANDSTAGGDGATGDRSGSNRGSG
jgi:hypothetical protein